MKYVGVEVVMGASVVIVSLGLWLWRGLERLLWRPYMLCEAFERQGVRGPPYKPFWGSLPEMGAMYTCMDTRCHDIVPRVLSDYHAWSSLHGTPYLYWFGSQPAICIKDPEMVKQVLSNKFGFYSKVDLGPDFNALFGKGVAFSEGSDWARHRRAVNPAFTIDKLKTMTKSMGECTLALLRDWQDGKEIDMKQQFHELSADIIARTAFSSSYVQGKDAFLAQKELQLLAVASYCRLRIPGFQYLPTKKNLHKRALEERLRSAIKGIINSRLDTNGSGYGSDLLGYLLEACMNDSGPGAKKPRAELSMDEIVDNCKTFFFAGHDTTSNLLTWTVFLLSLNPDWQEKLREEVLRECKTELFPSADMLSKLKLVNLVLLESMRLYGPVNLLLRKANKEMSLGNLVIPKDTIVTIPLTAIHRDKEYWGVDANEFNPKRFEKGASAAAKHPSSMIPFGIGPRVCVGQIFAMLEAKMVMAMILQRFSFSLSPKYKHAPTTVTSVEPQFGLPVIVSQLQTRRAFSC